MLTITIDNTDRTRLIIPESLKIMSVLTNQVDTASFIIKKFGTRTYAPTEGEEVIAELDGTKVFAGRIVKISEDYDKLDLVGYKIDCVDYTRDLDRRLVVETYENMTVAEIIADIKERYLMDSITITNVACNIAIKYIAFNYEYPSDCLKQLADLTGYAWYIDYDKDIHFFAKDVTAAPFELSDTGGKYYYETLKIRKDITPVRNTIYVRGGEYKADPFTVEQIADGTENVFDTKYRFNDLRVMVTGQEKSIGIDGIDNARFQLFDALYNFQEKIIKFREDRKPSANSDIKWWGQPYLPVIIKLRDNASVATFSANEGSNGIYEFKIIDKSIKSKAGAKQRAKAELLAYAATLNEGSFETSENGLHVGQRIRVQSTLRGIDAYYVINRLEVSVQVGTNSQTKLKYKVGLVTTKSFDYIDLLQKMLNEKDKEIVIDENEVLDEIEGADENLQFGESVTFTTETRNYQWGPGGIPQGRWNLSSWG